MPIEVRNLTYVYKPDTPFASTALDDVSFTIEKGTFTAIIGHTGSGKSTLIQHFNGLLRPSSGTLIINGADITGRKNLRDIRGMVGLVFQYPEHQLFEETVALDIAFGPRNLGLEQGEIDARVKESMMLVELDDDIAQRSPFELSGGQKRRVAIAGVLAMKPDMLILDEPTAGLDPRGRDHILGLLKRMHENGHTLVLVTHAMEDVVRLATRVIVMNHGRVEMQGVPADIYTQAERLNEIGLDVPAAARLAVKLRSAGFDVPRDAFTVEALAEALAGQLVTAC